MTPAPSLLIHRIKLSLRSTKKVEEWAPTSEDFSFSLLILLTQEVDKIMKPLKHVYMLEANTHISSELMREIYEKRYSRILIYGNIMAKDLMLVSPEKLKRIWKLKKFFLRPAVTVPFDEKLQNVLHTFK